MAFTEGQREAVQIWQRASKLDGGDDVTFNQLKAVLEAANYFELWESYIWERQTRIEAEAKVAKLREAVEKAVTELAAQARIDNYPADAPDGFVVRMLRSALKGGGESQLPLTEVRGLQLTTPANGPE